MRPPRLKEYLLPGSAERDEGFCQEILRLSHLGLRVVGGIEAGAAALLLAASLPSARHLPRLSLYGDGLLGVLGMACLLAARSERSYEWSRLLSGVSIFCGAVLLLASDLRLSFTVGEAALIMLVAVVAIPLRPMHTLVLGGSIAAVYAGAARWLSQGSPPNPTDLLLLGTLIVISTALTAVAYRQRHLAYGAYMQIVRSREDLRESQRRMLLSENSASMLRLAAGLSHELNTPMGALLSSVNTLLLLAAKRAASPPAEQGRLDRLQADLQRCVDDSAQRLQQTVARMQRFTNLDKSEVQPTNLNELLEDVAALLNPEIQGKAKLKFDFQPVPTMLCRRQQLSAVFSSLLNNAASSMIEGSIVISTRERDSRVEVRIRDEGNGIAPGEARTILDPGFKVVEGKVLTGNWHMFNSRQIIGEYGGEIRIASERGRGTTVTVTLPVGPV